MARSGRGRGTRAGHEQVEVDGRRLRLTNLDKVLYPEAGTTKAEVLTYWSVVAPVMIPHLLRRPVTRKRWPDGVGTPEEPGKSFFRKDLETSAPTWIPRRAIEHREHSNTYPVVDSPAVLAWFGQVAALEVHVPQWRFRHDGSQGRPDRMVLDLDPGDGVSLSDCAQVAGWCREVLEDMGLDSVPVTSGSKGIHLYAALPGRSPADDVAKVARELARALEADHPDLVTSRMKRSGRDGKVFIDWSQNNGSKTTVAPYSLRGRPGFATVAAPRTWAELATRDLAQLDYRDVIARVQRGVDPLAALLGGRPPQEHPEADGQDRLADYRAKRDRTKTPEPVPAATRERPEGTGSPTGRRREGPIFVIQEHHARALHYDTRIERDGVLVSWAVPKGPPLRRSVQRLAVQTEDHPIEYAEFSGRIPRGEYGAGQVSIWDAGTAEIETWEDGKVVVVLHGGIDGGLGGIPRRYALIRTDGHQWLIRLTDRQPEPDREPGERSERPDPPDLDSAPLPEPLPGPMLATPAQMPTGRRTSRDLRGTGWVFEGKWDGYRAIVAVGPAGAFDSAESNGVRILSRRGEDLTARFPELAELADLAPAGTVLDGEIVALGAGGRPDFGRLQLRGRVRNPREIAALRADVAVHFFAFDVLHSGAEGDLTGLTYRERRERLAGLLRQGRHIHLPGDLGTDLDQAVATSAELGLEGVVGKRQDSRYRPGRRSRDWVKIAHHEHQAVVLIGWRAARSGDDTTDLASVLMAIPDDDGGLRYVGRVGSGMSAVERSQLRRDLGRITRKTPAASEVPGAEAADATWVTPKLVAEVRHHGLTRAGRLRQPTWRGLRPDVSAGDVTWER